MSRWEITRRLIQRWSNSIYFFILLSLILGSVVSVLLVPKPTILEMTISGAILEQADATSILDELRSARDDKSGGTYLLLVIYNK